jgi:hypothetical protein
MDTESALFATVVTMYIPSVHVGDVIRSFVVVDSDTVVLYEHTSVPEVLRVSCFSFRITGLGLCLAVYRAQVTVALHDAPS